MALARLDIPGLILYGGSIAPGRFADIVLLDDLDQCHVEKVWVGGKLVAHKGFRCAKKCL